MSAQTQVQKIKHKGAKSRQKKERGGYAHKRASRRFLSIQRHIHVLALRPQPLRHRPSNRRRARHLHIHSHG